MWSFPVPNIFVAQDVNLNIRCIACFWQVCSRSCLAGHRERFSCHNTTCPYHCPIPLHPQPASNTANEDGFGPATDNSSIAAATSGETTTNANGSTTSITTAAPATPPAEAPNTSTTDENATVSMVQTSQASPRDNLIFRETTTREWFIVNGRIIAPMKGQPLSLVSTDSAVSSTNAATEASSNSK